jgi:hypothetical protein
VKGGAKMHQGLFIITSLQIKLRMSFPVADQLSEIALSEILGVGEV